MDTAIVVANTDQLHHFTHEHPLSLVYLQQPNHRDESDDDEDEDKDDIVEEVHHGGQCHMCKERIWSFHLCYYYCKSCDYSLHKFCAELPEIQSNHPLHPGHELWLKSGNYEFECRICNLKRDNIYRYSCYACYYDYTLDIICANMSEQKINHPSHSHQLERMFRPIVSSCVACGKKHEGVFFQCATCPWFWINLECAMLPAKLLIQKRTNESFTHSHPLTLAHSFPDSERYAKFDPWCRVCGGYLYPHLWIYKCEKCIYYVHVDCATSKRESFMSILQPASIGKTYKNFKDDEHPNLLHCPFQDEGDTLLKRHMSNEKEFRGKQHVGEMVNRSIHEHQLILFDKQAPVGIKLHDPMKKTQLLCDGCVKPIMTVPFYMCCQYVDEQCCFVLHEWCTRLPPEMQDYVCDGQHTPILLPKVPHKFFGVFTCKICELPSNGFAYGCTMCEDYVDINCAFIPGEITHEAHPDHLLSKLRPTFMNSNWECKACKDWMVYRWGFQCLSCDFYIHIKCALLLPRVVKQKCDEHPLSLRYEPVENHISEYFCEICEEKLNPWEWFYHCTACAQSMHATCVPIKLQYEQAAYRDSVYRFLNVKFGGILGIKGHSHSLSFVQGVKSDGKCNKCHRELWYEMIFKCLECKFALHYKCAKSMLL